MVEGSGTLENISNTAGEEIQVIPSPGWWWAGWSVLSFLAIFLNLLFLTIVIKNRKSRDLRSLITAVLITISVLDILDIGRIVPSIVTNLHKYEEFRIVYCSVGVFHAISVSLLLILLGMYLLCPCRDTPPLYYPASKCSGSLPQKLLIPLFLVIGAAAAGVVPLLKEIHEEIVDNKDMVPHSCIDHTRLLTLLKEGDSTPLFWSSLYQTLITLVCIPLPLLLIPPVILVATLRTCLRGHCCQIKYKQSAGELLVVLLVTIFYLGSMVGSLLPLLDQRMEEFSVELQQVPVLWELANAAARPAIYFLANPAVWDGLRGACCNSNRSYGSLSTKEDEVALAPVVERISSL